MKRLSLFLVGTIIAFLSISFVAAKSGCRLEGSWMGFSPDGTRWLATYHGESANAGTNDVEVFLDPTLGGLFPDAVSISSGRGVWVRTGGNSFSYTMIVYGLDEFGGVNWIIKNSGVQILSESCNRMSVDGTIELFEPDIDPFEGDPLLCLPDEGIVAVRMRVDPPCCVDEQRQADHKVSKRD